MTSALAVEFCCPHCGEMIAPREDEVAIGNLNFWPTRRVISGPLGTSKIGSREAEVLYLGWRRLGMVLAHESWLEALNMWEVDSNLFAVVVWKLRQALKAVGADVEIRNYPWRGYGLFAVGASEAKSLPEPRVKDLPGNPSERRGYHGRWTAGAS